MGEVFGESEGDDGEEGSRLFLLRHKLERK